MRPPEGGTPNDPKLCRAAFATALQMQLMPSPLSPTIAGLFQQFIYPGPIHFRNSATIGFWIPNRHGLGAQMSVLHQTINRHG